MLDQGNTCGGFRRQKLVQVRGRRAITQAFAFSHALLKPGMGDAMGVSQIRSRGSGPGSIRVKTSGVARAPDSLWAAGGRPSLDTLPKCHRISSV